MTSAVNIRFPPIDPALTLQRPWHLDGDPCREIGRRCAGFLNAWEFDHVWDQFPYSWGYTIFRTDYSSDERFAKAVKLLTIYADNWLFQDLCVPEYWRRLNLPPQDPRLVYEVRSRLLNVVVENRTTLDNATIEAVGQQFDIWKARILAEVVPQEYRLPVRFTYCIMLDKESIDNLLMLPQQPSEVRVPDIYYVWVKVVTKEIRNGRRLWLRIGVYDLLWEHWLFESEQEFEFEEHGGWYDEEGVCNLYGPPTPCRDNMPRPDDYVYTPPRDERPGHPARTLCDIRYERLEP